MGLGIWGSTRHFRALEAEISYRYGLRVSFRFRLRWTRREDQV